MVQNENEPTVAETVSGFEERLAKEREELQTLKAQVAAEEAEFEMLKKENERLAAKVKATDERVRAMKQAVTSTQGHCDAARHSLEKRQMHHVTVIGECKQAAVLRDQRQAEMLTALEQAVLRLADHNDSFDLRAAPVLSQAYIERMDAAEVL